MSSEAIFDQTVFVDASRSDVWGHVKRLALSHGRVTARDFLRWIVASSPESSHVYHIESLDPSGNRLSIRHLVIPNPNVGQALQPPSDFKAVLDDLIKAMPQVDDPKARDRLQNLVSVIESQPDINQSTVQSGQGKQLAGLPSRFFAYWIDIIILGVIVIIMTAFLPPLSQGASIGTAALIYFLYYCVYFTFNNGQTVGKSLVGIRVIQANGSSISLGTAIIRLLGYFINGIVLGLGWLNMFVDKERRGWHDHMAGTIVVRDSSAD